MSLEELIEDLQSYAKRAERRVRKPLERAAKGYSQEDTWSFDIYLSETIIGGLTELRQRKMGYPMGLLPSEWDDILVGIIEGFEAHLALGDAKPEEIHDLKKKFNRGMKLLKTYYFDLWD